MSDGPAGSRILVVDDEPAILRAVSRILGRRHRVACLADAAEAVREAPRLRPELAIVDIRLREATGFEVMRDLKAALPETDVILMTGNVEEPDETLARAIEEGAFYYIQKPFDRRVLLALVERCLELRRLREDRERYLRRMARELAEARRFQLSLLPPPRLVRPGLAVAAHYAACHELAGDIYDYVPLGDRAVALLIADVAGHGASAAMLTGVVKAAFRSGQAEDFEPRAVIDRVRADLRDFDASRFVTLCCARVDAARRELTYANAGHPEPILRTGAAGTTLALPPTGPLLCSALPEIPCEQATVVLDPGATLLLYTDGVTEARCPAGGMFGHDRLVATLSRPDRRGRDLIDDLLADLADFCGAVPSHDDVTILTLDLAGP